MRVFNPYASSNVSSLSASYEWHENIKRRAYGQRIQEVEHGSFTPIVLSATGGMTQEATIFHKCLASLLATRWNDDYARKGYGLASLLPLIFTLSYTLLQSCPALLPTVLGVVGKGVPTSPGKKSIRDYIISVYETQVVLSNRKKAYYATKSSYLIKLL